MLNIITITIIIVIKFSRRFTFTNSEMIWAGMRRMQTD